MGTQFDAKGKIFTQVVTKEAVQVTIQTVQQMVRGTIHIRRDSRLKDELNEQEHFLAITDAVILNEKNEEIYRANFLALNITHIVWVIPDEEVSQ